MKTFTDRINTTTFLTDGGLETDLIFTKNIDLPHFAAFPLLDHPKGVLTLKEYYSEYLEIAKLHHTGFILESPTWRANTDWGFKLGYDQEELFRINSKAIHDLKKLRDIYQKDVPELLISGQIGPRGDGYQIKTCMTPSESLDYHSLQIIAFKKARADMVSAITMTYPEEAIGISLAAREEELPVVISFTLETDGKLPNGDHLQEAISKVDRATGNYPAYYMINCAHPSHFFETLKTGKSWNFRVKGIRANASCKSHAELDESTELDPGDINDLGQWHVKLKKLLPGLSVFGGCCGTDASHVAAICKHVLKPAHDHSVDSNSR